MPSKRKTQKPSSPRKRAGANGDYTERERCIFTFWDGTRQRAADPLRVQQRLAEVPDLDLENDPKMIELAAQVPTASIAAKARASLALLVAAVHTAFGTEPFCEDEQGNRKGLLDAEALQLLMSFAEFISDLKKKAGPTPTPSNASGPPSSPPAGADGPSTITSSAASTSTGSASSTAAPLPSGSESPSPSAGTPQTAGSTA